MITVNPRVLWQDPRRRSSLARRRAPRSSTQRSPDQPSSVLQREGGAESQRCPTSHRVPTGPSHSPGYVRRICECTYKHNRARRCDMNCCAESTRAEQREQLRVFVQLVLALGTITAVKVCLRMLQHQWHNQGGGLSVPAGRQPIFTGWTVEPDHISTKSPSQLLVWIWQVTRVESRRSTAGKKITACGWDVFLYWTFKHDQHTYQTVIDCSLITDNHPSSSAPHVGMMWCELWC